MIIIRKAKLEDKVATNDAHKRSIREVCSKDYNEEQIRIWSDVTYSDEIWENSLKNDIYYVLEKDTVIEGFIHGRIHSDNTGEIMGLYFTPAIMGQGYGRKAFELVMKEILKSNPTKVIISGTKTALPFYKAMGFKVVEVKQSNIRGTVIETNEMELCV